jgi:hypothetical protein
LYSASVQARIALTVVVVHVVSFCIHDAGALAQAAAQLTTVNTCQFVHTAGTSFTVTAHVFQFTLVTHADTVHQLTLVQSVVKNLPASHV